ncbi:glycolipid 2-alpha-mannosyltransferase-like [Lingula anatina]|uniref:Glycolipid 2-alpha-mannosyltransferase-like n=1 Tax=Lingula anatina TaxID=7574 RepID=A0A1S3HAC4_LINAN|nr:glycolipid 2-alpha-mannosyltransferase-like [Lingula anatina]|eukprot:XP_013382411.1 glycolipid 2-alpha-mannosyltransferase-like [Lingula anatina]
MCGIRPLPAKQVLGIGFIGIIPFILLFFAYNTSSSQHAFQLELPPMGERRPTSNDGELALFNEMMRDWSPEKPRAVIYYLISGDNLWRLERSLRLLNKNFNRKYMYPVIIFYEQYLSDEALWKLLSQSPSPLFFQRVTFTKPDSIKESLRAAVKRSSCPYPLDQSRFPGYNHMCRFHVRLVFESPFLANVTWYWRLDDDSEILRYISYDVFKTMENGGYMYGYNSVHEEDPLCVEHLLGNVTYYLFNQSIEPKHYYHWPKLDIFWNNFEISNVNFWRRPDVWQFIDYIDRQGGIYYDRWGDAPIKTDAVTIFLDKNQTYFFSDLRYRHGVKNDTWIDTFLSTDIFEIPVVSLVGMVLLVLIVFVFVGPFSR